MTTRYGRLGFLSKTILQIYGTCCTNAMRIIIFLLVSLCSVTSFECPEVVARTCRCYVTQRFISGYREEFRHVDCSSRRLLHVPFMNFPENTRIHEINLQNNSITSFSTAEFANRIQIRRLDISTNPIAQSLSTGLFNNVARNVQVLKARDINLNLQNITSLSFLDGLDTLEELDLSRNFVHGVNKLPALFSQNHLPALKKLSLSLCRIQKVSVQAFAGIDNVREIDLSQNHLVKVPRALSRLRHLTKLNLRENDITVIYHGDFSDLPHLQVLDLSRNLLGERESFRNGALFGVRNSLTHLYLQDTQLFTIPTKTFSVLRKLHHLDLSSNRISDLKNTSFQGQYNLVFLDISDNPLAVTNDMFVGVEDSLFTLRMRKSGLNAIPLIPLQRLKVLRHLDLSYNALLAIESLAGITARRLSFQENRIRYISPQAFSLYRRPVDLDVSQNILASLDFVFKSDHCTFYKLNITGNGLLCDCSVERLINSGRTHTISGDCLQKDGNSVSFRNQTMVSELQYECGKSEYKYCLWFAPKSSASLQYLVPVQTLIFRTIAVVLTSFYILCI